MDRAVGRPAMKLTAVTIAREQLFRRPIRRVMLFHTTMTGLDEPVPSAATSATELVGPTRTPSPIHLLAGCRKKILELLKSLTTESPITVAANCFILPWGSMTVTMGS